MENKKRDNETGIFITKENCRIYNDEQSFIVNFIPEEVGLEEGANIKGFQEEVKGQVGVNKDTHNNQLLADNKKKQPRANFTQIEQIGIDKYDFLDWIEKRQKKKTIFNSNPCEIEYEVEAEVKKITKITIPIRFWTEYKNEEAKNEEAKNGKVVFGGNNLVTILTEINASKDKELESYKDKLLSQLKDLNAVDKKERQDKEKFVEKIKKAILLPLVPFAFVNKKIQEYKKSKIDAEKDKNTKINHLKIPENSNRFSFTYYEFNGLSHCDVSYVGDKKKNAQGVDESGKNYGTSTILLEGSLKKKFLEIENNYKNKDAEKKLAQLNLLGSYFVSSGKDGAAVAGKDTIPQLNLENPKGKQKVKFAVSVIPNEDNKKVKLVSYNIDKGILEKIKKVGEGGKNAMKEIEKDFYVKLPKEINDKDYYTKFTISRDDKGELSISRNEKLIYNNKFRAYGEEKQGDILKKMNECFEGAIVQIASSVERGVKKEGEADTTTKKVTSKVNNVDDPNQTEIRLTGENLLEKLSKSSKKPDTQQK